MNLYQESLWTEFADRVEENYRIKTYPHFDPFFDFRKHKSSVKSLVADVSGTKTSRHGFLPFVKVQFKIPRYRYQEGPETRDLDLTARAKDEYYESTTKIRPIFYASHYDTYVYGFYGFALNSRYQKYIRDNGFHDCILAYRTDLNGKCNIQFAKEAFDQVHKIAENGPCTAIALDIRGYFDNLDHGILKKKWCKVLGVDQLPIDQYKIYKNLTQYSYSNKDSILKHFRINLRKKSRRKEYWQTLADLVPNNVAGASLSEKLNFLRKRKLIIQNRPKPDGAVRGIPQGSSMSAVLANLYLIDFDEHFFKKGLEMGYVYRRYCDDLLFICPSHQAHLLEGEVSREIRRYKLEIQEQKTDLIEFALNSKNQMRSFNRRKLENDDAQLSASNEQRYYRNLQYLGFEYNGRNITIRSSSLSRYFRKMKGRITKTVMMARGKRSKSETIFKKQLYSRYTHLGKNNFLNYAYRASLESYKNSVGVVKEGMNSPSIRRQLRSHFTILKKELKLTDKQISTQRNLTN